MRKKPIDRYEEILIAALELARDTHILAVNADVVGKRAGCTRALVRHYLGGRRAMRQAVVEAARHRGFVSVHTQAEKLGWLEC